MKNNVENKYNDIATEEAANYIKAVLSENCADCTKTPRVTCGTLLNCSTTDGNYFVKYRAFNRLGKPRKAPFFIHCDLFPYQVNRVMSYRHMVSEQYSSIYWKFIVEYTTIKPSDFDHALHNPGLRIFFTLDYDKITSKIGEYFTAQSINYKFGGSKDANDK